MMINSAENIYEIYASLIQFRVESLGAEIEIGVLPEFSFLQNSKRVP